MNIIIGNAEMIQDEADIDPLCHGSRLGRWLVYLLVKEARGTLSFEEHDPRGSVVTIRLPKASTEEYQE